MRFGDLFVVQTQARAEKGQAVASAAPRGAAVGVFITPKSLLAFPTASFVVTLLGLFTRRLFPFLAASVWVPLLSSCFVGVLIFVATVSEPTAKPRSWQQWFISIGVAIVNIVYLAASSLGLLKEFQ